MDKYCRILQKTGPLTGKDFVRETGLTTFEAWRFCAGSDWVINKIVGRRYLRLDLKVEGYARLSPSIMREFLNYTVVGISEDSAAIDQLAKSIEEEITSISARKINLARDTVDRLLINQPDRHTIINKTCFIIAGDVVFGMAHAEPRPEFSTGELVKGSDLDIITVTDNLPEKLLESLDALLYREKYNLLMNPVSKEEIDYIVKDLKTVEEQLAFNDFKKMVASKILEEGQYLFGNRVLFDHIKTMVAERGIPEKVSRLEEKATQDRVRAEKVLLEASESADHDELMALFYTTEEKEEIF